MAARHAALKAYQREHRERWSHGLVMRTHRALSWLDRAEQCAADDADGRFIFLWIAFNAAYAQETPWTADRPKERDKVLRFFRKLAAMDKERRIYEMLWQRYSGDLRLFLDNRFVFQPFWDAQLDPDADIDWQARLAKHKKAAHQALAKGNVAKVLSVLFHGLYTLRNQLIHGNATWHSKVNRPQLKLGADILGDLVPVVIDLMMRHPQALWGDAAYPVVDG